MSNEQTEIDVCLRLFNKYQWAEPETSYRHYCWEVDAGYYSPEADASNVFIYCSPSYRHDAPR